MEPTVNLKCNSKTKKKCVINFLLESTNRVGSVPKDQLNTIRLAILQRPPNFYVEHYLLPFHLFHLH